MQIRGAGNMRGRIVEETMMAEVEVELKSSTGGFEVDVVGCSSWKSSTEKTTLVKKSALGEVERDRLDF